MKTTTEIEINISGAKITNAMVMPDGTCKLTSEMANAGTMVTEVKDDDEFILVEASKLSLNDEFMQYEPETDKEREFKLLLAKAIKSGLKDFKRPKCDPSFNDEGVIIYEYGQDPESDPSFNDEGVICYEYGQDPARGKSYNWWNQVAKKFKPEYNSRLGTKTEYVAFIGVLIKQLVEMGWSIKKAWDAVCNDSKELGHYCNSKHARYQDYESTGCREICGFYDLANFCKILADDERSLGFWRASGGYWNNSCCFPLASLNYRIDPDSDYHDCVGWLVLD